MSVPVITMARANRPKMINHLEDEYCFTSGASRGQSDSEHTKYCDIGIWLEFEIIVRKSIDRKGANKK